MSRNRRAVGQIGERNAQLGTLFRSGLLILSSLAAGPKHGYAMMEDILDFSGTRLEPGTLYGAITRLEPRRAGSKPSPARSGSPPLSHHGRGATGPPGTTPDDAADPDGRVESPGGGMRTRWSHEMDSRTLPVGLGHGIGRRCWPSWNSITSRGGPSSISSWAPS